MKVFFLFIGGIIGLAVGFLLQQITAINNDIYSRLCVYSIIISIISIGFFLLAGALTVRKPGKIGAYLFASANLITIFQACRWLFVIHT
jgi:hypothetical protein